MTPDRLAEVLEALADGPPWDTAWLRSLLPVTSKKSTWNRAGSATSSRKQDHFLYIAFEPGTSSTSF